MKEGKLIIFFTIFGIISIPIRQQLTQENIKKERSFDTSRYVKTIAPACIEMFMSIEKNAKQYGIPMRYALGIAYAETRYNGPFHWEYNPEQQSGAGALGPMQIMPSTANLMWKEKVSKDKLLTDIDFNVETSMKLLSVLHLKYKDWKVVFGAYNTGHPIVNEYAERVYNF